MIVVDLNILLYAVNEDAPHHDEVAAWWDQTINGDESVGLPWVVALGFLRLTTNPRVFPRPLPVDEAAAVVDAWFARPNVHAPLEKDSHWKVLRDLIGATGTGGNLTTDAHLAALAITRDAVLASCDNDFARFAGLRYFNPLV